MAAVLLSLARVDRFDDATVGSRSAKSSIQLNSANISWLMCSSEARLQWFAVLTIIFAALSPLPLFSKKPQSLRDARAKLTVYEAAESEIETGKKQAKAG